MYVSISNRGLRWEEMQMHWQDHCACGIVSDSDAPTIPEVTMWPVNVPLTPQHQAVCANISGLYT